jgi:hypothetical protein
LDFFGQVGKGLSKDARAQKLAFQHWIEAVISFFNLFKSNDLSDHLSDFGISFVFTYVNSIT